MSVTRALALALLFLVVAAAPAAPCTIFSGRAPDGTVWFGNNEDMVFDFDTYLNVLPGRGRELGVLTFTYERSDAFIQGGMNEKRLFFDFNALPPVPATEYRDWDQKRDYPGGDVALVLHILRTCSTVADVVDTLGRYRLPSLLAGQMHVADAAGTLAVINVDSVLVTTGPWQVTTNFNVCTRRGTPQEASCWRFPIVQRLLAERGASLESFVAAARAAAQQRAVSTIYTTIANLSTGEFRLYYGGDYEHPYVVDVGDLLVRGKRSYRMRSLFPDAPLTRTWETYLAKGAATAAAVPGPGLGVERRAEVLKFAFLAALLVRNDWAGARVLEAKWREVDGGRHPATGMFDAYAALVAGDRPGAEEHVRRQIAADSASTVQADSVYVRGERAYLARLEGAPTPGVRFELKGHADAKLVCLHGASLVPFFAPLQRTTDGWAGDFAVPPGEFPYAFVVDGRYVLDPANPKHAFSPEELIPRELSVKTVP